MKLFLAIILMTYCHMVVGRGGTCHKSTACNTVCRGDPCAPCDMPMFQCTCTKQCFDVIDECMEFCPNCGGTCNPVNFYDCPGANIYTCPCIDKVPRCYDQKANCDAKCTKNCNGQLCIVDHLSNCTMCAER